MYNNKNQDQDTPSLLQLRNKNYKLTKDIQQQHDNAIQDTQSISCIYEGNYINTDIIITIIKPK